MLDIVKKLWYLIRKIFCFVLFGTLYIPFAFIITPIVLILSKNDENPDKNIRLMVSWAFRSIQRLGTILRIIEVTIVNKEILDCNRELIVCTNHPTFIDVVVLMGMIPYSDCIIRADLGKSPFLGHIASKLYTLNSMSPEETISKCTNSLNSGLHLIQFLEGTRTDFNKELNFKRSAAHIALNSGHKMLPVYISVNDTSGYGKGDFFFDIPESGKIKIRLEFLEIIDPKEYTNIQISRGARQLTDRLKADIIRAKELNDE